MAVHKTTANMKSKQSLKTLGYVEEFLQIYINLKEPSKPMLGTLQADSFQSESPSEVNPTGSQNPTGSCLRMHHGLGMFRV